MEPSNGDRRGHPKVALWFVLAALGLLVMAGSQLVIAIRRSASDEGNSAGVLVGLAMGLLLVIGFYYGPISRQLVRLDRLRQEGRFGAIVPAIRVAPLKEALAAAGARVGERFIVTGDARGVDFWMGVGTPRLAGLTNRKRSV